MQRRRLGIKTVERATSHLAPDEAITWARAHGSNVQQSVRQFFNHALDRELIDRNRFARIGASKRKRRIDRPDFELITSDRYERLRLCARSSRADDYGLIIAGAILAVGEAAIRPSEVFALDETEVDAAENVIHIRRQWGADSGIVVWPKDDDGRWVVMSPALRGARPEKALGPAQHNRLRLDALARRQLDKRLDWLIEVEAGHHLEPQS